MFRPTTHSHEKSNEERSNKNTWNHNGDNDEDDKEGKCKANNQGESSKYNNHKFCMYNQKQQRENLFMGDSFAFTLIFPNCQLIKRYIQHNYREEFALFTFF